MPTALKEPACSVGRPAATVACLWKTSKLGETNLRNDQARIAHVQVHRCSRDPVGRKRNRMHHSASKWHKNHKYGSSCKTGNVDFPPWWSTAVCPSGFGSILELMSRSRGSTAKCIERSAGWPSDPRDGRAIRGMAERSELLRRLAGLVTVGLDSSTGQNVGGIW